jgi:hypothetical protein
MEGPEVDTEVRDRYRWAVDRTLEQNLTRWTTPSLHLEHRWQSGSLALPFVEQLLVARQVDLAAISGEIAHRAVTSEGSQGSSNGLLWQLQDQAKAFLRARRYASAGALFEFYVGINSEDASALNNLGFCLIPSDAAKALQNLERAKRLGYFQPAIVTYNIMCCLRSLSQEGEALDAAEYYWQREREAPTQSCTLWKAHPDGWKLYEEADPKRAIAGAALDLARELGATERAPIWESRLAELGGGT